MPQGLAMRMTFGQRLKRLRENAGMTQEQLARAAGISNSFLSKLEQKEHDPSWSTVQALTKALGVSYEAFADDAAEPEASSAEKPATKKPKDKK